MAGFDIDRLDPEEPFEIDERNLPHLYKHLPTKGGRLIRVGAEDLLDAYLFGDPVFFRAERGPAEWLMMAEIPGLVIVVPLAPTRSGDPTRCRPIGLYRASIAEARRYKEAR
jgi:hypothetical protein